MNTIIKTVVGAVVVGLLGLTAFTVNLQSRLDTIKDKPDTSFGNSGSPTFNGDCINLNGVPKCYYHPPIYSATTTPVAFPTPNATSTMALGSGCHFTLASTTAKAIRVTKGLTMNASSTLLFGFSSVASGPASVVATTSSDSFVFGPRQWVNISMIGGTGVDSPTGSCSFEFTLYQPV